MALTGARGRWMDGRSAEEHPARIAIEGPFPVIHGLADSVELARWPLSEVHVDTMQEGGVVHVECARSPHALLAFDDSLFLTTLRSEGAKGRGLSTGRRGLAIGLASFGLLALGMGGVYLNAAAISGAMARRIPVSIEHDLAPHMKTFFERSTCRTPRADAALQRMLKRLDPDGRVPVDLRIVNVRFPNAFALPGSMVLLTRELIEQADDADEVAGVLAHELAHVEHRHVLSHMIRNALLGAVWAVTLGDYSGLMVVDPKTAYETVTLKFSREAEAQADATALEMLTARGISTRGMINFFERHTEEGSGEWSWLSSHPPPADRIAKLSRQALPSPGPPTLDSDTFYELRKACVAAPRPLSLRDLF